MNLEQPPCLQDANLRFNIDTRQSVSIKAATNDIQVNTPQRLTLAQFQEIQPTQAGTGAKENDRSRKDHRTIIGAKYINQVTPKTETSKGRLTVEYDNKDINQKFGIILEDITPNWKTRGCALCGFCGRPMVMKQCILFRLSGVGKHGNLLFHGQNRMPYPPETRPHCECSLGWQLGKNPGFAF